MRCYTCLALLGLLLGSALVVLSADNGDEIPTETNQHGSGETSEETPEDEKFIVVTTHAPRHVVTSSKPESHATLEVEPAESSGENTEEEKPTVQPTNPPLTWSYNVRPEQLGPLQWPILLPMKCGNGRSKQSPIDIVPAETQYSELLDSIDIAIPSDKPLDDGEMNEDQHIDRMRLLCNGQTVQVNILEEIIFTGGGLESQYKAAQFHFHWGTNGRVGTDHRINNEMFMLEMQIVTYDMARFASVWEALETDNGIAIFSILFKKGEHNDNLDSIVNNLHKIPPLDFHARIPIDWVDLHDVLPANSEKYFRYEGSVTTPTCQETVKWTVFAEHPTVHPTQMEQFYNMTEGVSSDGSFIHLVNNWRPPQPLKGRTVLSSFPVTAKTHVEHATAANGHGHDDGHAVTDPVTDKHPHASSAEGDHHAGEHHEDPNANGDEPHEEKDKAEKGGHHPAWSYNIDPQKLGPLQWSTLFPMKCGSGKKQSPIDIVPKETKYDELLSPIDIVFPEAKPEGERELNEEQHKDKMQLLCNGHTVQVNIMEEIIFTGGGLGSQYKVAQFHFHWGAKDHAGTEHRVNDKMFRLEMHIVTYDMERFATLGEAVGQTNGIAVFGILFKDGPHNANLDHVVNNLKKIPPMDSTARIPIDWIDIRDVLPAKSDQYFRYQGSLTTPTCGETVRWTIFAHHPTICPSQMAKFYNMTEGVRPDGSFIHLVNNWRPPQPLHNRTVLSSFNVNAETLVEYTIDKNGEGHDHEDHGNGDGDGDHNAASSVLNNLLVLLFCVVLALRV